MAYIGTKPANQITDSTLIADGTVTTADLANGAVTPTKLSTGAPNWDTSGNVGIGTSSPTEKLHLSGSNCGIRFEEPGGFDFRIKNDGGTLNFSTDDPSAWSTKLSITNNGNVGIGTSSPTTRVDVVGGKLQVSSGATLGFAGRDAINIYTGTGARISFYDNSNSCTIGSVQNGGASELTFSTNGTTERMRIDSSGGIWSSTQDQGFQLRSGGTRFGAMYFSGGYLRFQTYQTGNTWMRFEHANGSATEFRDGSILNTNNSYGGLSDIRFKENIEPARNYLADICKVNVVKYSLKAEESDKPTKLGVIAQEVQEIFPNIVDSDKPEELSVKYSVFVPMLIKSIQELKAQLDESNLILTSVKTELDTVKAELNKLKNPPVEGTE